MIPFSPPPEPPDFDEKVRQRRNTWLAKNPEPKKGTRDYWSPFKSNLADGYLQIVIAGNKAAGLIIFLGAGHSNTSDAAFINILC